MHHTPTRLLAALGLSTALLTAPALAQEVTNVDVTLLLVNDIYSIDNRSDQGGFARLSAVVQAEREANDNVIYAVAGDFLSPSLLSSFDQGEHIVELFNMTPPDVIVPGNHEFDFGEEVFRARMAEVEGSNLLAANMRNEDGTVLDGFSDTMMMDVDGLMIGIIGLAADDSDENRAPARSRFPAPWKPVWRKPTRCAMPVLTSSSPSLTPTSLSTMRCTQLASSTSSCPAMITICA